MWFHAQLLLDGGMQRKPVGQLSERVGVGLPLQQLLRLFNGGTV